MIKLLILNARKKDGLKAIKEVAIQLKQSLEGTEFYDQLLAFRRYMVR